MGRSGIVRSSGRTTNVTGFAFLDTYKGRRALEIQPLIPEGGGELWGIAEPSAMISQTDECVRKSIVD
jgi:hypothetical protein